MAFSNRWHPALCLTLSGVALLIGYLGFGHWSPFRFFPQMAYTWSSSGTSVHIASSWLFVMPLMLGGAAVVLLFAKRGLKAAH